MPAPLPWPRVLLGGTPVDLLDTGGAVDTVVGHATRGAGWPLGVMSANLDHIHHFGYHGPSSLVPFAWAHPDAGDPYPAGPPAPDPLDGLPPVRWLNLLDGAPLVRRAEHLTGHAWPRLAGSDLIAPVLDPAAARRCSTSWRSAWRRSGRGWRWRGCGRPRGGTSTTPRRAGPGPASCGTPAPT